MQELGHHASANSISLFSLHYEINRDAKAHVLPVLRAMAWKILVNDKCKSLF